ncbi:MAG TPA: hypothetical protein PLN48_15350 [Lachnospiraceae bacterium]|nr:hypothetical protein [Lachnospiraceae bacterium]
MDIIKIKDRAIEDGSYRTILFLLFSITVDIIFLIYSILWLLQAQDMIVWYLGQTGWYATLITARCIIFAAYEREKRGNRIVDSRILERVTGTFLLIMSGQVFAISYMVYSHDLPMNISGVFVILNGLYVIGKLAYSVFSKKKTANKEDAFKYLKSKQFLSVAENLFLFTLIFCKLIDMFKWREGRMLVLMAFAEGCMAALLICRMGTGLLLNKKVS